MSVQVAKEFGSKPKRDAGSRLPLLSGRSFLTREVVGKHKGPRRANNQCTEAPPRKDPHGRSRHEQGDLFDRFDCDCAFYRRIPRDSVGQSMKVPVARIVAL
jgi:hypothetical protein